jgi:hypothetical protein
MRFLFAAAALMAAVAAPAFAADPAKPSAPAPAAATAPAAAYVSPCKHPPLEPYPIIPDAATAKNSDIARANKSYATWVGPINVFADCKTKELQDLQVVIRGTRASSPEGRALDEFNGVVEPFNAATDAFTKTGVPLPTLKVQLKKPGEKCPPVPDMTPAPIPQLDPATAKKSDIQSAQNVYGEWAGPRYVYIKCQEAQMKPLQEKLTGQLAPLIAKQDAIIADYDSINVPRKAFNLKWDAFGKAYDARMKAAAEH